MKKRILIIINDIRKAQEHEWFIRFFNHNLFEIEFALINSRNTVMDQFLTSHNITTWHYNYNGKGDLPALTWQLYRRMKSGNYDAIHTHLFIASLAGLTAGWLARIPKRIMTRHHSDYHHVWFPSAVKYDRYTNSLATHIVAISKNVQNILQNFENVKADKIVLIHHGLDLNEYKPGAVGEERVQILRSKYAINSTPVIGAISRFTEWKGVQFIIPAFVKLLKAFPDAVLILANASGDYSKELKSMLIEIPERNRRIIEFENDIAALYKLFDVFVHVPISASAEAFGQTYIEALASAIPSVFTLSGIAPEFAVDNKNCVIVPYCDNVAIYDAVLKILNNKEVRNELQQNGYRIVEERFDVKFKMNKLEKLYSE